MSLLTCTGIVSMVRIEFVQNLYLGVEEKRVHAPGEGTVCCALLRVRISDMSVIRTADVQVLVGRGVGELAAVLGPEVIVVRLVVLLKLVCPDGTDSNCEVSSGQS